MRIVLLILCLAALAAAAPPVQIVKYINNNDGTGSYKFLYVLSDGTQREEIGELVNKGLENEHIAVRGYYSWYSPEDDKHYSVTYKSDEDGYQPDLEEGPGYAPALDALLLSG